MDGFGRSVEGRWTRGRDDAGREEEEEEEGASAREARG